jgi:WD40 repeat protein
LIAGGAEKGTLKVWKTSDGSTLFSLSGASDWVEVAVFSPDGRLLASKAQDGTVWLWNTSDGLLLRTLTGYQGQNSRLAFSPDGGILAFTDGGTVHLWGLVR